MRLSSLSFLVLSLGFSSAASCPEGQALDPAEGPQDQNAPSPVCIPDPAKQCPSGEVAASPPRDEIPLPPGTPAVCAPDIPAEKKPKCDSTTYLHVIVSQGEASFECYSTRAQIRKVDEKNNKQGEAIRRGQCPQGSILDPREGYQDEVPEKNPVCVRDTLKLCPEGQVPQSPPRDEKDWPEKPVCGIDISEDKKPKCGLGQYPHIDVVDGEVFYKCVETRKELKKAEELMRHRLEEEEKEWAGGEDKTDPTEIERLKRQQGGNEEGMYLLLCDYEDCYNYFENGSRGKQVHLTSSPDILNRRSKLWLGECMNADEVYWEYINGDGDVTSTGVGFAKITTGYSVNNGCCRFYDDNICQGIELLAAENREHMDLQKPARDNIGSWWCDWTCTKPRH